MSNRQMIFVVDDDSDAREMVGDYLRMHGFDATLCDGGAELREALRHATPELVVLDLNMPGEDGLSLIRFLKQTCGCPIIMLTATASTIDRVVGLELGADDYIAKPCELRELVARIRSILRRIKWSPARNSERRLAAIVAFDLVDFTRFVHEDEAGTLAALDRIFAEAVVPSLVQWHGVLFKMLGDGALVEFPSVVDAMEWAVEFQKIMADREEASPARGGMKFRVGVAVGDVIVSQLDRLGEGVALAARAQEIARPAGIAVTEQAYQFLRGRTAIELEDAGVRQLKNIATPMRIWTWPAAGATP
ncbi:MAG TPA: response regulator [Rhodoblastus sp.]|nr:response regulator [Rhodoblastus sp.]